MAPRLPRTALGVVLGTALFGATFVSPAGDVIARRTAPLAASSAGPAAQRDAHDRSARMFLYNSESARLRDATASYEHAVASEPAGHRMLYVMGSSEFSGQVPQNPSRFLPSYVSDLDFYESGRAYTNTYVHALELAAVGSHIRDRKVTLIVSPQWFPQDDSGADALQAAFSPTQWQEMLANPALDARTRFRLVRRGRTLLGPSAWGDAEAPASLPGRVLRRVETPLNALLRRTRVLQTEAQWSQAVSHYDASWWQGPNARPVDKVNWASAEAAATSEGRMQVSNPLGISDDAWHARFARHYGRLHNSMRHVDFSRNCPQWEDLQLFLDVAREEGLTVQLIGLPMNGRWYDHAGYPAARRARFYRRLDALAARNHVQLVDLEDKEYEPYWFQDGTHPGWRGWLDVTHAAVDFARS